MADKRNCREYCRFSQYCHREGEPGLDPEDCPTAWRIEDCIWDAKCSEMEEHECEGCHNSFETADMFETEYGYYCYDCFNDRMEIEDRNINE